VSQTGSFPADDRLDVFGIDKEDPENICYAQRADTDDIIKYSGGTWSIILDDSALPGTGYIHDFVIDPQTGYMWVVYFRTDYPMKVYIYRSDQTTDISSFTNVHIQSISGPGFLRGAGMISAYDGRVAVIYLAGLASYGPYCLHNSAGWVEDARMANTSNVNHFCYLSPLHGSRVFMSWSTSDHLLYYQLGAGAGVLPTALSNGINGGQQSDWWWQLFMPHPTDSNILRFIVGRNTSLVDGSLYKTTNGATFSNIGKLDIGLAFGGGDRDVTSIAEWVNADDYDMIIYGSDDPWAGAPHTIFVADGDADLTPDGKSGTNCGTPPYTDAIRGQIRIPISHKDRMRSASPRII